MTSHEVKRGRRGDRGVRRPVVLARSVVATVSVAGAAALAVNSGVTGLACSGPLLIGWG
jgi:hypothetical protein